MHGFARIAAIFIGVVGANRGIAFAISHACPIFTGDKPTLRPMHAIGNFFSKLFTTSKPQHADPAHYISLCCIIKDENSYLEEWLTYHKKIGVNHFYIYDNGSKIPIRDTVKSLQLSASVTVTEIPGQNRHLKAYQQCLDKFGHLSRWIGFIDIDEFIVPKTADNNLPAFLEQYESYGGLGISWLVFGSNGHTQKPAGGQLRNFTKRSEPDFLPNTHIKSIVQPRYVRSAKNSHSFSYKEGYFCVNEHFNRIEGATAEPTVDTIQLNHYYCRSLEEYHEKMARGYSDTKRGRTLEPFHYHDAQSNKIEDDEILKILDK